MNWKGTGKEIFWLSLFDNASQIQE